MLSQKTRYALKALIYLAGGTNDDPVSAKELASEINVSRKYLEIILVNLKTLGILQSSRGQHGGYALARRADEITFAEVIRSIDGPLALLPCARKRADKRCDDCSDEPTCSLREIMIAAREKIADLLEATTIEDAVRGTDVKGLSFAMT